MQLKFEQLDYQKEAMSAVVDVFEGETHHADFSFQLARAGAFVVSANRLDLSPQEIEKNLNAVQRRFGQKETQIEQHGMNFSVEMETGTGKTYVYLHTLFELNRRYGWQKFVIVVPSVAIREGVLQTLRSTREHFANLFDKPVVSIHVYDSNRRNVLSGFAQNRNIEILVMNIDAFKKESNVINRIDESGKAPIENISCTCPIVIMDEPQNMETELAKQAIEALNPLFVLRYSATHKNPYHKLYSLNPIEAYNKKLVKQIVVQSVLAKNDVNGAYLVLKEWILGKGGLKAKVELHYQDKKQTKKKIVQIKSGDDLFDKSGGNESYRFGYIVNGLDAEHGELALSNGQIIRLGESDDTLRDEIMKKQMECTIKEHLAKEKRLNSKGIKVLSLFFIDKVSNYRNDGKFARWFKEIYERETGKSASGVHDGYFSQDKDTNGKSKADEGTYDLIMRDKEKLLSFDSPLRFIFSHSALKEGWDNPNVFQICTLNETQSPIKKRQEIGRGLRLPVNQQGERVYDESVNILTIIPNESYESFAANLQKEYEDECGIKFEYGGVKKKETRLHQSYRKGFTLDPVFVEIWQKLQYKTRYAVQFEREVLIHRAAEALQKMPEIQKPQIVTQKVKIKQRKEGIWGEFNNDKKEQIETDWQIPDVLGEIQKKTQLTRQSIFEMIKRSGRISEIANNPQRFIDIVSEKILLVLHDLMIDGIQYFKLPDDHYEQSLAKWRDLEQNGVDFFRNEYTFAINQYDTHKKQKTIFENYIALDSGTEHAFAQDCECHDDVLLYFKLPSWFKVPTPIGHYNPDWALVMQNRQQLYFVAETKNTGKGIQDGIDLDKLKLSEQQKIMCAKKLFSIFDGVSYQVVEKLSEIK